MIDPKEVDTIEDAGTIDGKKVKIIKTIGGLHIAAFGKEKNKEEIVAYASHSAIVKHQLTKRYGSRFHQLMEKNENGVQEIAISYSSNLPQNLVDNGYDVFCLKKGMEASFIVTCDNMEIFKSDINDIKVENAIIKNSKKMKEFKQNDGEVALLKSIKEFIKGK